MLPDPNIRWQPVPSVIDGIERPPYILERGISQGMLRLIILTMEDKAPAFEIEVAIEAYTCVEEAAYSIANHGDNGAAYDGTVYLKEAASSKALEAYAALPVAMPNPRHFLFVGGDYCYETIGGEPLVRRLETFENAKIWLPFEG